MPLLIATGTEGRILSAEPDAVTAAAAGEGDAAETTVVLDSAQANVLVLAASPGGFPAYAGTDTDGLVYRIDRPDAAGPLVATAFFDAAEPEVAALAVAPDGRVYAGTADAEESKPGRLNGAAAESTGKPELPDAPVGDSDDADAPPTDPAPVELAAPEAPGDPGAVADAAPEATETPTPAPEAEAPADEADAPSDEEAGEPEASAPTAENYDALRETLREKLADAKKSGKLEIEGVASAAAAPKASRPRTKDQPAAEKKEGNAVYELLADGSFREIFRETTMVLDLALEAGDDPQRLLVATGGEGELHAVDLAGGATTLVRDLESQQVTALLAGDDGTVVAASNPAAAGRLPAGRPTGEAVYTSASLDAGRRALFGRLGLTLANAGDAEVRVETRSGSTADPESAPWSDWMEAGSLGGGDPAATLEIPSQPARFLQYRLTLEAREGGGSEKLPAVEDVRLSYAVPNLAPRLARLTLEASEPGEAGEPAAPTVEISWEANDPDGDALVYNVSWQQPGTDRWLNAAEDLTETSLTLEHPRPRRRPLPRPRHRQRPPRQPARLRADRHPPLRCLPRRPDRSGRSTADAADRDGKTLISGTVRDATGTVAGVSFRVDDEEAFRPAAAADLLFDSSDERFEFPLADLDRGESHVVTLRAMDSRGNATFTTVIVPAE